MSAARQQPETQPEPRPAVQPEPKNAGWQRNPPRRFRNPPRHRQGRQPRSLAKPIRRPMISGTSLSELLASGGNTPDTEEAKAETQAEPAAVEVDPAC
ncbi:MAG: hypothetical protein ACLVK4_14815 [Alistipes shahii]|uniref:hypothetical protein n=1 Tax=Alistipes shahii TaxID=328814 RepID=UPI00399C7B5F